MLDSAIQLLTEQSGYGLLLMFMYGVLLELPRYGFSTLALMLLPMRIASGAHDARFGTSSSGSLRPRVSVVVAGLNEADSIEKCIRSLRAQSLSDLEIVIVSDGSTDRMPEIARDLVRQGLADKAISTDYRCSKSSGVNLATRYATGDIIVNVDCDCSYDRFAIERITSVFTDPSVGAACGDIVPRNADASLISTFQAIEYLLSISLGKRIAAMFDQVVCVSGAFGAFRREALDDVAALDAGGGEDLDITLRLRRRGWGIVFVEDAVCYTDVPANAMTLFRQRMRWERDALRVRFRKQRHLVRPSRRTFQGPEVLHQLDFLLFNVLLSVAFPFYILFILYEMGESALYLLLAVQLGMIVMEMALFIVAVAKTDRWQLIRLLIFIPGYSFFNTFVMRSLRAYAYIQEWTSDASRNDSYVPKRVQKARQW